MYGKEIRENCSVRAELAKGNSSPDINKWIKPKNGIDFDDAEVLIEKIFTLNNTLISFCELCPFLALYMEKQSAHKLYKP
jgi:hypothetical protein